MSRKQLNRFDVLSKANAGFITVREASEALGLSAMTLSAISILLSLCENGFRDKPGMTNC